MVRHRDNPFAHLVKVICNSQWSYLHARVLDVVCFKNAARCNCRCVITNECVADNGRYAGTFTVSILARGMRNGAPRAQAKK